MRTVVERDNLPLVCRLSEVGIPERVDEFEETAKKLRKAAGYIGGAGRHYRFHLYYKFEDEYELSKPLDSEIYKKDVFSLNNNSNIKANSSFELHLKGSSFDYIVNIDKVEGNEKNIKILRSAYQYLDNLKDFEGINSPEKTESFLKLRSSEIGHSFSYNKTGDELHFDSVDIALKFLKSHIKYKLSVSDFRLVDSVSVQFLQKLKLVDGIETAKENVDSSNHHSTITEVVQCGNTRLFKIIDFQRNSSKDYAVINENHELYNYIDAGHKVWIPGSYRFYRPSIYGSSYVQNPERLKITRGSVKIKESEDVLSSASKELDKIHTLEQLNRELTRQRAIEKRGKKKKQDKIVVQKKVNTKIDDLKKGNISELSVSDMRVGYGWVDYHGQKIVSHDKDVVIDYLKSAPLDKLNFDLAIEYLSSRIESGTFDGINVEVTRKQNSAGIEYSYINGHRINKGEVAECVRNSLCYTTQEGYEEFLKKISKCSLKFHKYLQRGVSMKLSNPLKEAESYSITLPIRRKSNLNHIEIGDTLYQVKNSNKLIDLDGGNYDLIEFIGIIKNKVTTNDLNDDDIITILEEGKKEYNKALLRSKKLLEKVEKQFDISVKNHKVGNSTVKGYLVKGQLSSYVVSYDPDEPIAKQTPRVYNHADGRYICIVDKAHDQVGADIIVNRIYALHNDKRIASKVSTLR